MQIFDIIARPLGFILSLIYTLVNSYGLAIIIFTVIIRLVLLPLAVKQMKSQQEISRLQPKIREIEKKFKGDKAKIQEETMKLYKQEGVSMTGGCLPLLIQLPIIFGLYQVIYRPLAFLIGLSDTAITQLRDAYHLASGASEIELASLMQADPGLAQSIVSNVKMIDFNFLGINLAKIPTLNLTSIQAFFGSIDALWIIPILSLLTAVLSSWISKKYMPAPGGDAAATEQAKRMTNSMLFVMPLMSLYFAFILPAGVGVYWIISNVLAAVQQYALFKYIKPLPPIALDDNIVEKRPVNKEQQAPYVQRPKDPKQKMKPQNQSSINPQSQKPEMQRTQGQQPQTRQPGQRPAGQRPPGQRPPNTSAKKNIDATKKGDKADD